MNGHERSTKTYMYDNEINVYEKMTCGYGYFLNTGMCISFLLAKLLR